MKENPVTLTESEIAADPTLVRTLKIAAEEQSAPMSADEAIRHLRDVSRKDNG